MKSNIFTIMKKELSRFFGDKRMVLSTVVLPGLLIYVMYTFMGSAITNMYIPDETKKPAVAVINLPDSIRGNVSSQFDLQSSGASEEELKDQIANQKLDLLAVFPDNFDEAVAAYEAVFATAAPAVSLYYNSASTSSRSSYDQMIALLDGYESSLANKFDVNHDPQTSYDLASAKDSSAMIFSSMLPLLLMIFLFSGCMSVAPESIAGEKERGTIATLLITPVKRSQIAIGKISALAIIALLSGISSAAGTLLSLPKLMGGAMDNMDVNVYTVTDYVLLGVIILSTVLFLIAIISVISAFAKTIKEAQTYVTPLMIVVMLIGITAMFGSGAKTDWVYYLIPLYNSVQCMIGIFSFKFQAVNVIAAVLSNLAYTGIAVFVLTRMFNSERVIFSR